jgi:putative ABC transport system permease protein
VLGANRSEVAVQFLAQSLLSAALGVLTGLAIVELALPYFREFIGRPVPAAPLAALIAAAVLTLLLGLGAGALPAWRMAGVHPAQALRPNRSAAGFSMSRIAGVLVFAQFAVAIGLLVSLFVAHQQYRSAASINREFDAAGVFTLWGLRWPEVRQGRDAFMQQVRAVPGVTAVSATTEVPGRLSSQSFGRPVSARLADRAGGADGTEGTVTLLDAVLVDPAFFETYRVQIVAGRLLDAERELDSAHALVGRAELAQRGLNIVLNEVAVRELGIATPSQAVGKSLMVSLGGPGITVPATVVGVVRNARWLGLTVPPGPQTYFQDKTDDLFFSVRADPRTMPQVIAQVRGIWSTLFPRVAFEPKVVAQALARDLQQQQRPSVVFALAALVAVLLSAIGMYTLSAFAAQRQAREIALRRLMGASAVQVALLMFWRLTRPVLVAAVVACPLAWVALSYWLTQAGQSMALTPAPFVLAVLAAVVLAWLVAAGRVNLAVRRRLADELRYE